mmetsp:Transcript_3172/g.5496  ORF Transcript_3172/g.5496 Transcript_3172/m.5496 type:complete len:586 (+) Transcript_3172:22-1779(+)
MMELLQESLKMQRSLHGDRAHPNTAATLQKLGDLAAQSGDLKQGILFLKESLQMQRSLHGDTGHPGIAATLPKLGALTAESGDLKRATRYYKESLQMQRSLHGDNSNFGISITLYELGNVAMRRGDLQQAMDCLELSLDIQCSLHADRAHPGMAVTMRKLGDVMAQTGRVTESMRLLLEALRVSRSLCGEKDHPLVADALHSLGIANQRAGDFDQAHKFLKRSLQMKELLFDKKHPSLILTSNLLDQVRKTAQIASKFKAIRDLASFKEEGLAALTRDAEAMVETTSQIDKMAREILSKLQKPTSEHAESEDKAQGSVYDMFGQILKDAEDMSKPDLATNPDVHTTWAAACNRMIFASQKAAEIANQLISKGHFQKINAAALRLGGLLEDECADSADANSNPRHTADANRLHEFDFHSFVLSEASLIRQLARKILKVHGAQPADLEVRNDQIYPKVEVTGEVFFEASTEICMAFAGEAGSMVAGPLSETFETACNDIIGQTFEIEDLLLGFVWATEGARKSEQDSISHATHDIQGLVKPSGLTAKTSTSDDEASTASFAETVSNQSDADFDEAVRICSQKRLYVA